MTARDTRVDEPAEGRAEAVRSTAAACCGLVLAALPVFLVGGLGVQIRAELELSEAALGAAVSGAFLTGACAAPIGGRVADRIGTRAAVLSGSSLTVVALAGLAAAGDWTHLVAALAVAGVALALTDPGLAILLTRGVPTVRQGLAFGVKEASIPVATLASGLAVPGIALTLGWRWAFGVGLLPLAGLLTLLSRVRLGPPLAVRSGAGAPTDASPTSPVAPTTDPPRRAFVVVAVATALGLGAASGVGVFLTSSAVAVGLSPQAAGYLLATGSVAGIVARIAAGLHADRRGGEQFGAISWMLVAGAAGMAVGAGGAGPLLVVGTIGAFAGGWGWSGLLFLSLVRASPAAPGAAAGIGIAGLAAGNGLGPLAFGLVSQTVSYAAAWGGAAAAAALAALLMRLARRRLSDATGGGTIDAGSSPAVRRTGRHAP